MFDRHNNISYGEIKLAECRDRMADMPTDTENARNAFTFKYKI